MARRRLTPAHPGQGSASAASAVSGTGLSGNTSGLRVAPIAQVAGQSAEAAALREMAQGIQAARDEGRMIVDIPLSDVSPGFLMRDRIVLDREDLDVLKASIRAHGQRTPAEVAPLPDHRGDEPGYRFGLISGWRRLTALNELHRETDDPRYATLRAVIRQVADGPDSYVAMIEENEVRVGLSYFERARVVAELTRRGVFPDQITALRTLFATASRAKRSKIGSFVELVDQLDGVLRFPAEIPERLGLAIVARLRAVGQAERAALLQTLEQAQAADAAAEQAILARFCRAGGQGGAVRPRPEAEQIARDLSMRLDHKGQKITVTLEGAGADEALLERLRALLREIPD